ncbi:hypothetical protein Hanom_Chr10g00907851 [Helianthus anomalus]
MLTCRNRVGQLWLLLQARWQGENDVAGETHTQNRKRCPVFAESNRLANTHSIMITSYQILIF